MKKVFLVLVFALYCLNNIQAVQVKGYYISTTNDTVNVIFKEVPHGAFFAAESPDQIWYYDSTNQKKKLTPDMAIEIGYEYRGNAYRMLSRKVKLFNRFKASEVFLKLILDGNMKLFTFYITKMNEGMHRYDLLQIGDNELFIVEPMLFRKEMAIYLSDCPDLVKKIENKVYRSWDLELIVKEYNATCGLKAK